MTPKEKAEELFLKYHNLWINGNSIMAKKCALIAVDEILKTDLYASEQWYWKNVLKEIEKL